MYSFALTTISPLAPQPQSVKQNPQNNDMVSSYGDGGKFGTNSVAIG